MTEGKKALEFKHAHITGQAMRDHWGPIVERIAAETADWRDAWIYDLITENERLREALERIADRPGEGVEYFPGHGDEVISEARNMELIARAALKENTDASSD